MHILLYEIIFINVLMTANFQEIPDFCRDAKVDGITSLANGSIFVASGQYYWILNKLNDGVYENPTKTNAKGKIETLIPGVKEILSVERFANNITVSNNKCGTNDDLLFVYTNSLVLKIIILKNWKPINNFLFDKAITSITEIDWTQSIDATLFYVTKSQIGYEFFQNGNCSTRVCDTKWSEQLSCAKFQIQSIFSEYSSASKELSVYGFSGSHFIKCIGYPFEQTKCFDQMITAKHFFRFDDTCNPNTDSPKQTTGNDVNRNTTIAHVLQPQQIRGNSAQIFINKPFHYILLSFVIFIHLIS